MKKRILALLCASMMLLSGCGKKDNGKMTYWMSLNTNMSTIVDNAGKTDFAKQLAEKTGLEVDYVHPTGDANQAMGLLVASGDLPDMIEFNWSGYNGGGQQCIDDGIIIELNDLIDKHAPNFKKYLEENPEIDKMIKTESGKYYCFPFIRGGDRLLISTGPVYRRDIAAKGGITEAPKTVEDIEKILKVYKEQGVDNPFSGTAGDLSSFLQNFSTKTGFYYKDGKVTYGPLTPEYQKGIETFSRWYKDGLIDPNYVSKDSAALKAEILKGEVGMAVTSGGGGLGTWLDEMEGKEFDMVGFTYTAATSANKPENIFYNVESNYPGYGSVAITTSCKDPVAAVKYLDYGYSEEGHMFYNFGIEGETYNMENNKAVFTDLINNNKDWSQAVAMTNYIRSSTAGPFVQNEDYIDQFYYRKNQKQTLDAWLGNVEEAKVNCLPNYTFTPEEAKEYQKIMTEIESFVSEERDKFIMGDRPMSEWNDFVKELKNYGIEKAVKIVQTACDRYNKK